MPALAEPAHGCYTTGEYCRAGHDHYFDAAAVGLLGTSRGLAHGFTALAAALGMGSHAAAEEQQDARQEPPPCHWT